MSDFRALVSGFREQIRSPDGNITVDLSGPEVTGAQFETGAYSRYTETGLADQLMALAKLVTVAQTRNRRNALATCLEVDPNNIPRRALNADEKKFRAELDELEVETSSERITVWAKPGDYWDIEIEPGSLEDSDGDDFLTELLHLMRHTLNTLNVETRRIRDRANGPGIRIQLNPADR